MRVKILCSHPRMTMTGFGEDVWDCSLCGLKGREITEGKTREIAWFEMEEDND